MTDDGSERARLRSAVADYILTHGVNVSLSALGRAIGSGNRMLLYYFGSKESLIEEASQEAFRRFPRIARMRDDLAQPGPIMERLDAAWLNISFEDNLPFLRLFFERFGMAAHQPLQNSEFLTMVGGNWTAAVETELIRGGYEASRAYFVAVQVTGIWRGLQFALLSGTSKEVCDRAHSDAIRRLLND